MQNRPKYVDSLKRVAFKLVNETQLRWGALEKAILPLLSDGANLYVYYLITSDETWKNTNLFT